MKTAVVILPTYNEKDNIGPLIDQIQTEFKQIKNYTMKILVVDDNSPDGTQSIVKKSQKKYSNLFLVTGEKQGLGRAYIRGMDYAIKSLKAQVVFEMDADFQHNPKQIPQFLDKIDQGYDIVIGARYIKGGSIPQNWGFHRKILSRAGNLLVRLMLMRFSHHEWTNGFRAIKVNTYKQVRNKLLEYTGYTFQVAFLHQAFLLNRKIGEIPNNFDSRRYGRSKIGSEYVKNLFLYLFKQTLTNPPRIVRFVIVGSIGALIQLSTLQLYRRPLPFQLAFFLSIETAIVSNFIFSNFWTFKDRKLTLTQVPLKFIQFNLASAGSILIQQAVAFFGETFIGLKPLFILSFINFSVDTGTMFAITGILIGMFWNFFAYSKIIWKKKNA